MKIKMINHFEKVIILNDYLKFNMRFTNGKFAG